MNPPGQLSTEALHTATLLIYIYRMEMNPPGQSITEALHTATLLIYIYRSEMKPLVNQAQRPCIPLHCFYMKYLDSLLLTFSGQQWQFHIATDT